MELKEKIELLGAIPLFSSLDESKLSALFEHASTRFCEKRSTIINDGDESSSFYVIVSGKVRVYVRGEKGKEVTLNHMEAGECFGEVALLGQVKRSASVVAEEPCQFIVITQADFLRCISSYPDIALNVMRDLSTRLCELTEEVKSLALQDVHGRTIRALIKLADERDGRLIIKQCPSRRNLAMMVGSSREMVTRVMKDLEDRKQINVSGRTVILSTALSAN